MESNSANNYKGDLSRNIPSKLAQQSERRKCLKKLLPTHDTQWTPGDPKKANSSISTNNLWLHERWGEGEEGEANSSISTKNLWFAGRGKWGGGEERGYKNDGTSILGSKKSVHFLMLNISKISRCIFCKFGMVSPK